MKLSALKIFAIKLALFSSMLGYMAVDLFLWHGPLWSSLHRDNEDTPTEPAVAWVYGTPITEAEFERYMAEQNWLNGREECPPSQRIVLLMNMVRSALLRMHARYNDKNLPDFAAEAEEELQRLASRAKSEDEFSAWLASQGYTRESYANKLQAVLKTAAALERIISASAGEVSDEAVAKHYEQIKDELVAPEARPLKHIFFATLGKESDQVRTQAQQVLAQLENGTADFAALARQYSEDDRTAAHGGDLGWVNNDEYTPLLAELQLFGEKALPAGAPALVQSRWGWHILLPGEIRPARKLSLQETRESLRSAIRSAQYELAVQSYLDTAVRESFVKKHLQINHAK